MQMTLAQISKRIIASLIDYFLFSMAYAMLLLAFGKEGKFDDGRTTIELTGWLNSIPVFLWILTFPLMEAFEGKTLGKKLMKLQVMKLNGTRYTLLDSCKRRICDWIDFALLGLPALIIANNTSLRQRLGDLWAGTVVVDAPPESAIEPQDEATGL
ncbi:MAG TPA: RDD family protein [Flavitalea sp.]|nr:RDD family protein [Flavitalea sp.]